MQSARHTSLLDDVRARPFENDKISIVVFLNSADQCPYLLMRTIQGGNPWFSLLGAHELCIGREGSALQLKRWSRSEQCSKLWAALYFLTWEGQNPRFSSLGLFSNGVSRDGAVLLHFRRPEGTEHAYRSNSPQRVQTAARKTALSSVSPPASPGETSVQLTRTMQANHRRRLQALADCLRGPSDAWYSPSCRRMGRRAETMPSLDGLR